MHSSGTIHTTPRQALLVFVSIYTITSRDPRPTRPAITMTVNDYTQNMVTILTWRSLASTMEF